MRKHNNWLKGMAAPAAGMLLLACPLSSAFALTVDGPGTVLMIDGTDSNVTVNVTALDGTLPLAAYDFGFVTGTGYTAITSTIGSYVFNGGDTVNFALRNRGLDNTFGTGDDLVYSILDPADYANQTYLLAIAPSYSQNPVVSSPYYRSLLLTWDLDLNGVADTGFDLSVTTPLSSYDGMTPVPLPAAAWLFGSGLLGLAALARRRQHIS
jgi:hypothetical protein